MRALNGNRCRHTSAYQCPRAAAPAAITHPGSSRITTPALSVMLGWWTGHMPSGWRGPRTPNDPRLTSHHWRKVVRPYWQAKRLPCARCGKAIDYDGPRYLTTITGKRRLNPRYLCIGHKVSRNMARRMGWTDEQADAIANTQPECQACSNSSGAREGQRMQAARTPTTYRRW